MGMPVYLAKDIVGRLPGKPVKFHLNFLTNWQSSIVGKSKNMKLPISTDTRNLYSLSAFSMYVTTR